MAAIHVSSAEKTLVDAVPMSMLNPYQLRGRVRVSKTSYVTSGSTFESGSTITGVPLPKGAKVISGILIADGTSSLTLKVTINSVDLIAATAFGSDAVAQIPDAAGGLANNYPDLDCGGYSPIITSGGATAGAGSKIVLVLYYVVD